MPNSPRVMNIFILFYGFSFCYYYKSKEQIIIQLNRQQSDAEIVLIKSLLKN